jgi:putative membrane protein
MAHKVAHLFSETDLQRIKAAVQEAEKSTSGEIVPFLVDRSDDYEEAEWRGGALLGALMLLTFTVEHIVSNSWLPLDFAVVLLAAFMAFLVGVFLTRYVPAVKRVLAGRALRTHRVGLRASRAFLDEQVFNTRDRTGILLLLSVLEHEVLVLGDQGINARVQQSEWQDVVETLTRAIRAGRPADGFVEAIGKCGLLLQRSGVTRRKDDTDELPDNLRVRER